MGRSDSRDRDRDRRDRDRRDRRSRDRDRDRDRRDRDRDRERRDSRDREKDRRDADAPAPEGDGGAGEKRRKKRQWDVDGSGNTVHTTPKDPALAAAAAQAAAGMAQMQAMQQKAMQTAVLQQQAAITRRARRLHVGNLPPGMQPDAIKELFDTTMRAAKLTVDEDPCVNGVHMAGDNRFCFLEFRTASECSNALALDGMQLLGKPLRVARPNDYMPAPDNLDKTIIPKEVSDTVTSSNVPNNSAAAMGPLGALGGMGGMGCMGAGGMAMAAMATPSLTSALNPLSTQLAQLQQQQKAMAAAAAVQQNPAALSAMSGASLAALSSLGVGGTPTVASGQLQLSNAMSLSRRARRRAPRRSRSISLDLAFPYLSPSFRSLCRRSPSICPGCTWATCRSAWG